MSKSQSSTLNGLPVKTVKVADLVKAPYNPRKISDEQKKNLTRSIEEFGCVEPIIVNEQTGNIVGGHQRLDALQASGIAETDVVIVNLEPDKEKALNVALNKISGEWDIPKLTDLFIELGGGSLDMLLTGFSQEEIDSYLVPPNFSPVGEDEQPRLDEKKPITCPECGHEFTP